MNASSQAWMVIALLVIALSIVTMLVVRKLRKEESQRLQQRFGTEYDHLLAKHGSRRKAEAELNAREKRVRTLKIVPLAEADAAKFRDAWSLLQSRFVDDPKGVVGEADTLVRDLMVKRGYPMGDFERRAADISVDHPAVVRAYRSARAIAERGQLGDVNTDELRGALVDYRSLFDELLEVRDAKRVSNDQTAIQL